MSGTDGSVLGGRVRRLSAQVANDERGDLIPVSFQDFGLAVCRAFLVRGRNGARRGGHGHHRGRQMLMRVSGRIDVELHFAGAAETVVLEKPGECVLIEPGVWSKQHYHGPDAALMVFCDTAYDPGDYFHDKDGWKCGSCE